MKQTINAALIAAALVVCTPAHAQWYAGATGGEARSRGSAEGLAEQYLDLGYTSSQSQADKRDAAYRVFGGYRFNRHFALEAAYADLGKFTVNSTVVPTGTFAQNIKTTGFDVSAIATLPVTEKFNLFARAGAFRSERKIDYAASGSVEILQNLSTEKQRQTRGLYGIGATYDLTQRIALRAEWTRHERLGNPLVTGSRDIEVFSLGVAYRFR
jgi:OmpA-OmpF porin, OOP family